VKRYAALAAMMTVVGCSSIITLIQQDNREDNRHDNLSCETEEGSQGLFDIHGQCIIQSPAKKDAT